MEHFDSRIDQVEPPQHLFGEVTLRVREQEELHRLRRRMVWSLFGSAISFVLFVPAATLFSINLWESGVIDYLALMLSDGAAILPVWREFAFAILESMPVMSLLPVLLCATATVWLGSMFVRDYGKHTQYT